MLEHNHCGSLASAEAGVDGRGDEHVSKAHHIVDDQGAAVIADQLGAVSGHQIGEETEEADGGIVGNDLDHVHDAGRQVGQELGGCGLRSTGHLHTEAKENGRHDEGQDGSAAPQLGKVGLGKEIDDHVGKAQTCVNFAFHKLVGAGGERDETDNDIHQQGGNGGGDQKGDDRGAQHLAGSFHAAHVCNGGGDGAEHHRNHNAEHQVDKHRAKGFKSGGSGPYSTDDTAGDDADEHRDDEPIILKKLSGWGHWSGLLFNEIYVAIIFLKYCNVNCI